MRRLGTRRIRSLAGFGALALALVLVLAACGGGNKSAAGVASLNGAAAAKGVTTTTLSKADQEQALLKYVQCLRGQGLDVPDPTVDANGNLTLRPQGGFRGGGADGATGGTGATSGTPPSTIDRTAFQKARDACGQPPQGAFGGFNRQNSQEFQDAALKFAKCMRSKGIDVPDPDFSGTDAPGAGGANANGRRGLFGSLDRNDPKVQQAFDACRSNLPQRPGGGGPGGAGTPTTTAKST